MPRTPRHDALAVVLTHEALCPIGRERRSDLLDLAACAAEGTAAGADTLWLIMSDLSELFAPGHMDYDRYKLAPKNAEALQKLLIAAGKSKDMAGAALRFVAAFEVAPEINPYEGIPRHVCKAADGADATMTPRLAAAILTAAAVSRTVIAAENDLCGVLREADEAAHRAAAVERAVPATPAA